MSSPLPTLLESNEKGYILLRREGAHDIYSIGIPDILLVIVCDRLVLDGVSLPVAIPGKGALFARMCIFWQQTTRHIVPNSLRNPDPEDLNWYSDDEWYYEELRGRAFLVENVEILPLKMVVRGYLTGTAWRDYAAHGKIPGKNLPPGLRKGERFDKPICSFLARDNSGRQVENASVSFAAERIGKSTAEKILKYGLDLYYFAGEYAFRRDVILAEMRLGFGLYDGKPIVTGEILTPDTACFWLREEYASGLLPQDHDITSMEDFLRENRDGASLHALTSTGNLELISQRYKTIFERICGGDSSAPIP